MGDVEACCNIRDCFTAPQQRGACWRARGQGSGKLDTGAIEREIGKAGEMKGEVYKISLPRTDLTVIIDGVKIEPRVALGSWMAFKSTPAGTVAHGDLVLTEEEAYPVLAELEAQGLRITGLHNHLLRESPRLVFLHFWGTGDETTLARGLKRALSHTKTPIMPAKEAARDEAFPEAESIQNVLGQKGQVKKGILEVSLPRPEKIVTTGVEVPPPMGMATSIKFQPAGDGTVAVTGDFVLTGDEVNRVAKALAEHGIQVTALHNHLVHETPGLYFMHFWAKDTPEKVAKGIKAGIEAMERRGTEHHG